MLRRCLFNAVLLLLSVPSNIIAQALCWVVF